MSYRHRGLELASAALDFPLTAVERQELEWAVAECEICREGAAAYRAQNDDLARLPRLDASDLTRSRIGLAAARGRTHPDRTYLALLAALLVLGSLIGGLTAGALRFDRDGTALVPPSPTITPAPSTPSVLPAPSPPLPSPSSPGEDSPPPSPGTPATPMPPVVPLIAGGGAEVVSDRVRVRSAPGLGADSERFDQLLAIGDRAVVVAGPIEADGYQWYFVRPHRQGDTELPSGWVAHASRDGEQWLAPALVPDSIAVTVDSGIRVRSAPGVGADSQRLEPLLDRREYLLVLDGPVEADGYTWYEVLSPGVQNNCWPANRSLKLLMLPGPLDLCPAMFAGWVASGSKDGVPWLAPGGVRCPATGPGGTTTLADVAASQGYALAIVCFGDTTLTFHANRQLRCGEAGTTWPMEPDWLNDSGIVDVLQDGGRDLFAAPHPDGLDVADCNAQDDRRYRIVGHFDDPAARTCRTRLDFSADAPELDHRTSEFLCRTTFVVTGREVLGP